MENQVFLVLNSEGKEVNSNMLCYAPSENSPQEIIAEFGLKELAQNLDVDFIKERIVKRPKDINRIVSENFEVSERTTVYYPIYKVKFANSNIRSGKNSGVRRNHFKNTPSTISGNKLLNHRALKWTNNS